MKVLNDVGSQYIPIDLLDRGSLKPTIHEATLLYATVACNKAAYTVQLCCMQQSCTQQCCMQFSCIQHIFSCNMLHENNSIKV